MASFLARYREPTLTAYTQDLKAYLGWGQAYDREVLGVTRGELEMYVRYLESRGYAAATVARRFGTVATFYKYAVIDGDIPANPAAAVTRPKVAWEGQKRAVLHPLEFAAVLAAARTSGPTDHALVGLLGMLGLRVSEACGVDIGDLGEERGHRVLRVVGKGGKPATIPLPVPVARALDAACGNREQGPLLRSRTGRRLDRHAAARLVTKTCRAAGITKRISPHSLRHTFVTQLLDAGASLRDVQIAARHADPRITMRYDRARIQLDRHVNYVLAARVAGAI